MRNDCAYGVTIMEKGSGCTELVRVIAPPVEPVPIETPQTGI
jgi:hypothetical protein